MGNEFNIYTDSRVTGYMTRSYYSPPPIYNPPPPITPFIPLVASQAGGCFIY